MTLNTCKIIGFLTTSQGYLMASSYLNDANYHHSQFARIYNAGPPNPGELMHHWHKLCACSSRANRSQNDKKDVPEIELLIDAIEPLVREIEAKEDGRLETYCRLVLNRLKEHVPISSRGYLLANLLEEATGFEDASVAKVIEEIRAELNKYTD